MLKEPKQVLKEPKVYCTVYFPKIYLITHQFQIPHQLQKQVRWILSHICRPAASVWKLQALRSDSRIAITPLSFFVTRTISFCGGDGSSQWLECMILKVLSFLERWFINVRNLHVHSLYALLLRMCQGLRQNIDADIECSEFAVRNELCMTGSYGSRLGACSVSFQMPFWRGLGGDMRRNFEPLARRSG